MAEGEHFTNGRCFAFGGGVALVAAAFGAQIGGWSHYLSIGAMYGSGGVFILLATVWITKSYYSRLPSLETSPVQASGITPGIPTMSALLGQEANVDFDAKKFFALAHYSPITAEIEKNIKTVAQRASPLDREAFYARFIGVGIVAYQHDITSFTIFRSQLKAMEELSSKGSLALAEIQKHYDRAVLDFPKTYDSYPFDQWLSYLKSRMLIVVYPSQMVELTFNGQDFLKYLVHIGKNTNLLIN